jgi:predicted site-specific integrase-resolvase
VAQVVKQLASGANESRPTVLTLRKDTSVRRIVVDQRERLTRCGFHCLQTLLAAHGRHVDVGNLAETDQDDLSADLVARVSSFTARL